MPHIKKLVLKGFKSFAPETEIIFENGMNVIVGANGSGKSNLTDAICFVLGRLSIKSMRATKAANLIFNGTKMHKPRFEASVKLVFANSDKGFSLKDDEVIIERIVRRNGQSIYKINDNVKTRQEILELLAQAGIDPHGFNIIMQGEIDSFVRMHGEERRKIIEEVAGISVYEKRKERSLRELEKTDEKLKEISAILRERNAHLRNLEQERQQALRFKHLEKTIMRCKTTLLYKDLGEKKRELEKLEKEIEKANSSLDNMRIISSKIQEEIELLNNKINDINSHIEKTSGFEQETLHREIIELKEEIAALTVKKENYRNQLEELERKKEATESGIETTEKEIQDLKKKGGIKTRRDELLKKRQQLESIEEKKRKFYSLKADIFTISERLNDKKKQLHKVKNEFAFIFKQIEQLESEIETKKDVDRLDKIMSELKIKLKRLQERSVNLNEERLNLEKVLAIEIREMERLEKLKKQVSNLDICPLCKTKITKEHMARVIKDADKQISELKDNLSKAEEEKSSKIKKIEKLEKEIEDGENRLRICEIDIMKLKAIEEKKPALKRLKEEEKTILNELSVLKKKKAAREKLFSKDKDVEENYDALKLEVEELARAEEENSTMEITLKERELERRRLIIKEILRDKEDISNALDSVSLELEEKEAETEEKEREEKILYEKFQKFIAEKTKLQEAVKNKETQLLKKEHELRAEENEINDMKIELAKIKAQYETLETDYKQYEKIHEKIQLLQGSRQQLKEKLEKAQQSLERIGSVNLKALEVYDSIKQEYEAVHEKVEKLEQEKQEILKIIEEIDKKKRRTFMKTLKSINEFFTRNFMQLSSKGQAFLEPENKADPFAAGLDITIKIARGKYFDVTSLSGGEQTLVALSLIFAIQEYKPYSFYILDEIDAALDKRNSERLAALIKKYMKTGQYIIVTHNDAVISESSTLYGVSMQDGISKILSLEI